MNHIIMAGSFQLPISVNSMYMTVGGKNGSRRILTPEARDYKQLINEILCYNNNPYGYLYIDSTAVRGIQESTALAKNWTSRKKEQFLSKFSLVCLFVCDNARSDTDNRHKCLQDAICEWLGIDDKRCVHVDDRLVIDRTGTTPHVECILRQITPNWTSGSLIHQAQQEIGLDDAYAEPYVVLDGQGAKMRQGIEFYASKTDKHTKMA